jgi:hypothetical protein
MYGIARTFSYLWLLEKAYRIVAKDFPIDAVNPFKAVSIVASGVHFYKQSLEVPGNMRP